MAKRYTVVISNILRKAFVIDSYKVRYTRMRKRVVEWAKVIKKLNVFRQYMYTLTYAPGEDPQPNDIRDFMLKMRAYYGDALIGYAWVAELQERGVLHYHVVVVLGKPVRLLLADRAGWWIKGRTNLTLCKSVFYLVSYLKKHYQKDFERFPKNARLFSVWINDITLRQELRYWSLSVWERLAVDMDGWSELPYWRKFRKEVSGWIVWAHYKSAEEASVDREWFIRDYDRLNVAGVPA